MARGVTYIPSTLIDRTFREKIVLVGVQFPGVSEDELQYQLDELALLVDTAGADVVARVVQRRDAPDPATVPRIGQGAGTTRDLSRTRFGHRGLRTQSLAGATAQPREDPRAHRDRPDRGDPRHLRPERRTPEGKAQVELALLQYRLPRLRRAGGSLSQQAVASGPGTGETQLETDRRRLVNRIHAIRRELKEIDRTRSVQRHGRARVVTAR